MRALLGRLRAVVDNYAQLLVASRNLDFFTSFYRWGVCIVAVEGEGQRVVCVCLRVLRQR